MQSIIKRILQHLVESSPHPRMFGYCLVPFFSTAGVVLVAFVDWVTGTEISLSILYLLPIGLSVWFGGLPVGVLTSLTAAAAWLALDRGGDTPYSHPFIPYWNGMVRLGFFLITTLLLNSVRLLTRDLARLVRNRTAELATEIEQRKEVEREVAEISRKEQERLACELHDQMGGYLAGVAFQAKAAAERLDQRDPAAAAEIRSLVGMINDATDQVREFSRLLDPMSDEADGLGPALTEFGHQFAKAFSITCHVEVDPLLPSLPDGFSHELRRIVQEASRNAVNHGKCRTVWISARCREQGIEIAIRSDASELHVNHPQPTGMGLRIMGYRAGLLGGSLKFAPASIDRPYTTVVCRVPLASPGITAKPSPHPVPLI